MSWYARIVIAISALAVATFWLLEPSATEYAIFVVAVVAAAPTLIGLEYVIPRRSNLVVEYRNPRAGDRAVLAPNGTSDHLLVFVRNDGRGIARSIDVRFERMGGELFNESGNNVGPDVDHTLHPPRYRPPADFVLASGREVCIARLVWFSSMSPERTGTVAWVATTADSRNEGVVLISEEAGSY